MPKGDFSVIIACGHGADSLTATLHALREQETPGCDEVIVLDDGAREGREAAVLDAASNGLPALYVKAPGVSRAKAWNSAISMSSAGYLALLDDDCIPPPRWLSALSAAFDDETVGVVGGPDRVPKDAAPFERCLDYVLTSFIGTLGVRNRPNRLSKYSPRPWNMALRADAIRRSGGFDIAHEQAPEVGMIARLRDMGYGIAYQPEALVHHLRETDLLRFLERDFRLGLERGQGVSPPGLPIVYGSALILLALTGLAAGTHVAGVRLIWAIASAYVAALMLSGAHASVRTRMPAAAATVPAMLALHHAAHIAGFASGRLSRLWHKG